jgi:hypothetical protein
MADRPRRSGFTQTFTVPDEDDIYDNLSIAPLEDAPGLRKRLTPPAFTIPTRQLPPSLTVRTIQPWKTSQLHLLRLRQTQSFLL